MILMQKLRWQSYSKNKIGYHLNLKLVIPEDYTCIASNSFFSGLGMSDKYLEKTALIRSRLFPGSYKTSIDTSPPPKNLSLHSKQINKVKIELDGQPSVC